MQKYITSLYSVTHPTKHSPLFKNITLHVYYKKTLLPYNKLSMLYTKTITKIKFTPIKVYNIQ